MYVAGVKYKFRTYDKKLLSLWWEEGRNGSSIVVAGVGNATPKDRMTQGAGEFTRKCIASEIIEAVVGVLTSTGQII